MHFVESGVADKVGSCTGGNEALEFLKSEIDGRHPQPCLIFLDVNMPGMNGFEFLEMHNTLPEFQKAKAIAFMLTTSLNPDDEKKSKELGAHGFIRKALTIEAVQEIAQNLFPENF